MEVVAVPVPVAVAEVGVEVEVEVVEEASKELKSKAVPLDKLGDRRGADTDILS